MIDIKQIRENPDKFKKAAIDKRIDVDIDKLLKVEAALRKDKSELQELTAEINTLGRSVPKLTGTEKQKMIIELSALKQKASALSENIKELQPKYDKLILLVPQPTDDNVPIGKDDTENVEIRKEGSVRQFDFEPKDHVQLGSALDIIDIERGVKLAGTRNYFLKGDGALLHWAVLRFSMDFMVGRGYTPMSVPILMKDEAMRGTGFFPGSEDQTYRMEADQLNLAGTAEVPLTAYRMGEILKADELPLKFVAMSSCFRREAGAAGKDTYGLYRIHQFDKIEQVVICENSVEQSNKFHEEILANSEGVMKALELPYRVVNVCTGDLGRGQVKKYDIEAWMPSRKNYCETHSASKFYEFQARRMNLRYKDAETKKNLFCHTLNNTVVASPRILIPILEMYQNADGSVTIPKVLRPYMGGRERIESFV
ncbi:MAG: serine--tRNA ligase [Phycisphaerae bacterium]|nr:serine--tRNA ligase [Phycisphaerae bacterium]MDD5381400.1 serine--tRNA ligase [Phycisphaerae bacterium]